MTKGWQYSMNQALSERDAKEILDTLGEAGWELVAVIPGNQYSTWNGRWCGSSLDGAWLIFKRPRPDLSEVIER